jgi:hypothetical protein
MPSKHHLKSPWSKRSSEKRWLVGMQIRVTFTRLPLHKGAAPIAEAEKHSSAATPIDGGETWQSWSSFVTEKWKHKATCFLEAFERVSFKWLDCWVTFPGVICALAGEPIFAAALAKWVLDGEVPAAAQSCNSEVHDSEVSLSGYIEFIAERVDQEKPLQLQWTVGYKPGLRRLANRCPLWESGEQLVMVELREFVQYSGPTRWISLCGTFSSVRRPSMVKLSAVEFQLQGSAAASE